MEDLRLYCEEMESQLKEWDAKFERLKVKARMAEGEAQIEMTDEIDFLGKKKRAVGEKLHALREATGEACVILREDMGAAMRDLESSFQNAMAKFK
jgi:hypothetical protein